MRGERQFERATWVVLVACFVILLLAGGTRYSFGVFLKPLAGDFGWDRATISVAVSINMLLFGIGQFLMGYVADRVNPQKVILLGIGLMTVSLISLYSLTSLWQLYFIFGVLLGVGLASNSPVVHVAVIAKWFHQRRGLALGILLSGLSAGQLVVIPLSAYFVELYGWRAAYLLLGTLVLLVSAPLALFSIRPPPPKPMNPDRRNPVAIPHVSLGAAWRTRNFWLLSGSFFVCGVSTSLIITHTIAYITDRGYSPMLAASMIGIVGGMNIIGTLVMGAISDRLGRRGPLAITYLLRGLAVFILVLSPGLLALYIFSIVVGFSYEATAPLTSAITADQYGAGNVGAIYGLIYLIHQIGAAASSYLGGFIFDTYQSYDLAYACIGVLLVMAAIISWQVREEARSGRS